MPHKNFFVNDFSGNVNKTMGNVNKPEDKMGIGDIKPSMRVYKNPKQFFDAWLEAGTLTLAATLLNNRGIRNRKGGGIKGFTVLAQANKWIVENPDDARAALIENDPAYDRFKDDLDWADFIIPRAHKQLRPQQFFRWLNRYNLLEIAIEKKMVPANYGKDLIK